MGRGLPLYRTGLLGSARHPRSRYSRCVDPRRGVMTASCADRQWLLRSRAWDQPMPSHPLSVPSQSGIRGIRAYLGLLGLPPWPAWCPDAWCPDARPACLAIAIAPGENFLYVFKGARSAPRVLWRIEPARVSAPWRARCQAGVLGGTGIECTRGSRRTPAGSSAFAPAAHGGLPPVRYRGHRPSPVGRRHARRPRHRGNGYPPDAPVLSRGRSPSRALATLASHAMALRATLDSDLPRITWAPIGWMARTGVWTHVGAGRAPRAQVTARTNGSRHTLAAALTASSLAFLQTAGSAATL